MKTLNEYLNANVKLDNNVKLDEFKKFRTKEEICDFLEDRGFERHEINPFNGFDKMDNDFEKSDKPLFYVTTKESFNSHWVRFSNGNKSNIFFWRIPELATQSNYVVYDYKGESISHFTNFEAFKKYVKNYFDW